MYMMRSEIWLLEGYDTEEASYQVMHDELW